MNNDKADEARLPRREFLIGGISTLAASLLLLPGCGGGGQSGGGEQTGVQPVQQSAAVSAPTPPDPNEVQHADLVFDGLKWTDNAGNPVDLQAHLADARLQPRKHAVYGFLYIWQPGWGWHWFYMAYDTGHPFGRFNYSKPHINIDRYYSWSDMQADIKGNTNKRTWYDGHFTIYRDSGALCAYYSVSIDKKYNDTGTKYDACSKGATVAWAALIASTIAVGAYYASMVEPIFEDVLANVPL